MSHGCFGESQRYGAGVRRVVVAVLGLIVVVVGAFVLPSDTHSGQRAQTGRTLRPSRQPATTPTVTPPPTTTLALETRGPRGNCQPVTFAFAGDVHFVAQPDNESGAVSWTPSLAALLQADPTHVLAPIAPVLSGADIAMVNLETAITDRGE